MKKSRYSDEQSIYAWNKQCGRILAERDLGIEIMKEIAAKNGKRTSSQDCSALYY